MMSGNWASDIAVTNFLIADTKGADSGISNPSALKMLEAQLEGSLKAETPTHQAAFAAYWIANRKPFKSYNLLTASMVALGISGASKSKLDSILNSLKNQANVEELTAILEQ